MKTLNVWLLSLFCLTACLQAQETFSVTGTAIPNDLLRLNYGNLPRGVAGMDLNICNASDAKHSITSSAIFQALSQSSGDLRPIGRQIMLAAILRNQNHNLKTWLSLGLGTTTSVLSVLGNSTSVPHTRLLSVTGLGALIGQQVLNAWSPVLAADQVEKFEAQVLEPALVLDGGSCLERTVFVAPVTATSKTRNRPVPHSVAFRVQ